MAAAVFVGMEVVYNGYPAAGEKEMQALRDFGTPADDGIKVQDYVVMQTQEDEAFGHGVRSYIKNGMVSEFTRELADAIVDNFVADPRLAFFTHTAGGAVETGRGAGYGISASQRRDHDHGWGGGWMDPAR